MKIHNKAAIVAICCTAFYATMHAKQSNDNLEEEFINKMDQIQRNFSESTNAMQSALTDLHNKLFSENAAISPKDFPAYDQLQRGVQNQHASSYYQQSSSSLSFANTEKTIKIIEQKDNASIKYIITVTDKTSHNAAPQEHVNTMTDLQELALYLKKTFRSQPADKILHECINALQEEQKDRVMHVETATNGNETKYTIEIAHKMKSETDQNIPAKKQSRKNKKSAHRS